MMDEIVYPIRKRVTLENKSLSACFPPIRSFGFTVTFTPFKLLHIFFIEFKQIVEIQNFTRNLSAISVFAI